MIMRMKRSDLGLRVKRGCVEKSVGTADVPLMEINLTAEKNHDENYDHHDDHHAAFQLRRIMIMMITKMIIMIRITTKITKYMFKVAMIKMIKRIKRIKMIKRMMRMIMRSSHNGRQSTQRLDQG